MVIVMNIKGEKVLVVGTGVSGIAAAALLYKVGAYPLLFDENDSLSAEDVRRKLPEGVQSEVVIGTLPENLTAGIRLAVFSPGVPTDTALAKRLQDAGVKIWGEVELGYAFSKGKAVAVTGTNGKTTTTALTGKIMQDYYESVFVVGNIGNPYTAEALHTAEDTVTVAEISSFQLETIESFRPVVSAILNITPDHLNRHHTMEAYVAVKESITRNQTREDVCVLNFEDAYTREFGENRCPASVIFFSSQRKLPDGYYMENGSIWHAESGKDTMLLRIDEMKLLGTHNVENVMAAIAVTAAYGVPMERILASVREFKAVEHRIEYVATKKGVDYYNDSKGTNPDAAIRGIQAMNKPTILIGGGCDKQSEYDAWIEAFDGKVKWLVLMGQTREKIAQCARKHGFHNILMADSLEEVMALCEEKAEPGDAVLLSPACASWGMFPNYEVRGSLFKELVNQIEE